MKVWIGIAVVAVLAGTAASARDKAAPPKAVNDLLSCRSQTDDQARLRCYDTAAAALETASTDGTVLFVDKEDVKEARRGLFGFDLPKIPFLRGNSDEAEERQIQGKVKSVQKAGYESWAVELESGAVWQTTEGRSNMDAPRPGADVLIKRGPVGGYMISFDGKRSLRAKRIR